MLSILESVVLIHGCPPLVISSDYLLPLRTELIHLYTERILRIPYDQIIHATREIVRVKVTCVEIRDGPYLYLTIDNRVRGVGTI
jgi:hypothetical protein